MTTYDGFWRAGVCLARCAADEIGRLYPWTVDDAITALAMACGCLALEA